MRKKLEKLLENASSLYFNYPVAAILECKDGTLFYGVNVETSSPAAGICAERNAIYSAIAHGYKKEDFRVLHLMAKTNEKVYPCFICRQAISDYCPNDMDILIYHNEGLTYTGVNELCVYPFGSEDLK